MGRHRAEVRPRYGRIAMLFSSLAVTGVAVLGGTGVLPTTSATADDGAGAAAGVADSSAAAGADQPTPGPAAADPTDDQTGSETGSETGPETAGGVTTRDAPESSTTDTPPDVDPDIDPDSDTDTALPADSGAGRRVVFSEERQRVWLVESGDEVVRTYLVSGSVYDNLDPGTYSVYSRSEHAYGIDDSGTMRYFVRFTQGERAAIGFHDIPVDDGEPVQSVADLGTPQSHGCIRQRRADAVALWEFAPLGTTVVVTA